jgi:hypothetical protein
MSMHATLSPTYANTKTITSIRVMVFIDPSMLVPKTHTHSPRVSCGSGGRTLGVAKGPISGNSHSVRMSCRRRGAD